MFCSHAQFRRTLARRRCIAAGGLYYHQQQRHCWIRFGAQQSPAFVAARIRDGFVQHELNLRKIWHANARAPFTTKICVRTSAPAPPIELQREFARRVGAVEKLKTAQRASLAELDALFDSLQHRAFRGEL